MTLECMQRYFSHRDSIGIPQTELDVSLPCKELQQVLETPDDDAGQGLEASPCSSMLDTG
jgi:hypothetical protein